MSKPNESNTANTTPVENLHQAARYVASLRKGRSGTVIGSVEDTNAFLEALYVPDRVDNRALSFFNTDTPDGNLFILLGSAGDGKTAIVSRAYRESSQPWLDPKHLNLDATASPNFGATEIDHLQTFLDDVSDGLTEAEAPRRGLAINLGIALKFFADPAHQSQFENVYKAIEAARDPENFTEGCLYESESGIIVANLSHRRLFNTHPDQLGRGLLSDLVAKFDYTNTGPDTTHESPFAAISDEIEANAETHPIAYNLYWLADPDVQESVVRILAAKALISNQYLNPRRVLHYLSHVLVPPSVLTHVDADTMPSFSDLADAETPIAPALVWNSTYDVLTEAGTESARLDPCSVFDLKLDEVILAHSGEHSSSIPYADAPGVEINEQAAVTRTRIRLRHLRQESTVQTEERSLTFRQFTATRATQDYLWEASDGPGVDTKELQKRGGGLTDDAYDRVVDAIKQWSQHTRDDGFVTIADGKPSTMYRFLSEWDDNKANLDNRASQTRTTDETQLGKIWFVFENKVAIPVPYELYRLLSLIADGYNPDAVDPEESEGVRLLHSQLSQFTDKATSLRVRDAAGQLVVQCKEKTGWEDGISIQK